MVEDVVSILGIEGLGLGSNGSVVVLAGGVVGKLMLRGLVCLI